MDDDDHYHFLVKPMFEVFCITIHPKHIKTNETNSTNNVAPCTIRGIARILDEDAGTTYDLYIRKPSNLEAVPFGGFLSITGLRIVPFKSLKLALMLYDTSRGIEIANDIFELDYSKPYDYNRVHVHKAEGRDGFAYVYHSTFQHGIAAFVDLVELRKQVGGGSDFDKGVSGTVFARLKRMYGDSPSDAKDEFPSAVLFKGGVNSDKFNNGKAQFNTPIELFSTRVVVPIDCYLVIGADFCDNDGTKIAMDIKFKPAPCGVDKDTVAVEDCEMRVEVEWRHDRHSYDEIIREIKVIDDTEYEEESEPQVSCDVEEPLTCYVISTNAGIEEENSMPSSPEAEQPSSSISRWRPYLATPSLFSFGEVFSVLICVDNNDREISGTVEIIDAFDSFIIFNGKQSCSGPTTLSILGTPRNPRVSGVFAVDINLKDNKGRIVSKGFFEWSGYNNPIPLYNRHMCSVIQGDIGYAVVHYSMFASTFHARVRASLIPINVREGSVEVFGRITCEYGNYEYPTPYHQKYYHSTIFSKPREDCVEVKLSSVSTLPLLKNMLSVPLENSLILDVNLTVIGPLSDHKTQKDDDVNKETQENVHELVEFKSKVDGYFLFEKDDYIISICVEWGFEGMPGDIKLPLLPDKRSLNRAMEKASLNASHRTIIDAQNR